MKHLLLVPFLASAGLASAGLAYGAPDLDRIHKDVTVMSTIIDGAFEADKSCENCAPKIATSYLANQGAVFTVKANTWRSFITSDSNEGFSFVMPPAPPHAVRRVEITEMVGDILSDVGVVMDEVGTHIEHSLADLEHSDSVLRFDSSARRDLRDLNRERRELEYQRREYEIELIHASEEERKRIEGKVADVEKRLAAMEKKQVELSRVFEEQNQEREAAREAARKKAQQEDDAQFARVEDIVLRSLCDYGTTLKNIPAREHVSLVFERKSREKQQVIVMEMDDITNCKDVASLRSKATSYLF